MSYIYYSEKYGVHIKPVVEAIRLYALLKQFEELLVRRRNDIELKNLYNKIVDEIKLIEKYSHEENTVYKYFPIGFLLEDSLSRSELVEYIREMSSSIEKGITELSEATIKHVESKAISSRPPNTLFIYPLEKLMKGYKYIKEERNCLISIPHSKAPFHDKGILSLGRELAKEARCHMIYSLISRVYTDYNRGYARLTPYRRVISYIIKEKNIRILIDLHGKEEDSIDVDIGWANGMAASYKTLSKLLKSLDKYILSYLYESTRLTGGDIIRYHSLLDKCEAFQLEISYNARTNKKDRILKALNEFIEKMM